MGPNDTWEEKRELLKEEKAKYMDAVQIVARNWAKIVPVAIVILSYIQYSYKYGVCLVFNLPFSAVTIRLADFIPIAVLVCFIAFYVFDFFLVLNPNRPEEAVRFSFHRVLCGTIVDFITLNLIFNDENKNILVIIAVSVVPPLIVEFILNRISLRGVKESVKIKYKDRIGKDTEERLYYRHFVQPCLITLMAVILLIPLISGVVARHRDVFEICTIGEETYAVIFNNSNDYVVLEPAVIEGDSLTIYTDYYKNTMKAYVDTFSFRQFEHVTITEGKDAAGSSSGDDEPAADQSE